MSQFPNHPDPRDDDDATYDNDHWEDLEDDRDLRNDEKSMEYLASLERRGYFI